MGIVFMAAAAMNAEATMGMKTAGNHLDQAGISGMLSMSGGSGGRVDQVVTVVVDLAAPAVWGGRVAPVAWGFRRSRRRFGQFRKYGRIRVNSGSMGGSDNHNSGGMDWIQAVTGSMSGSGGGHKGAVQAATKSTGKP